MALERREPLQKTEQTELRVSVGAYRKENGSILYQWENVEAPVEQTAKGDCVPK